MGKTIIWTWTAALVGVLVTACGGEGGEQKNPTPVSTKGSTTPAPSGTANGGGSSTGTVASKGPCAPAGSKANDKGIGAFCDKSTKCTEVSAICTGDFGAPPGASFCTKLCASDADCGTGAFCFHDPRGNACITDACDPKLAQ